MSYWAVQLEHELIHWNERKFHFFYKICSKINSYIFQYFLLKIISNFFPYLLKSQFWLSFTKQWLPGNGHSHRCVMRQRKFTKILLHTKSLLQRKFPKFWSFYIFCSIEPLIESQTIMRSTMRTPTNNFGLTSTFYGQNLYRLICLSFLCEVLHYFHEIITQKISKKRKNLTFRY